MPMRLPEFDDSVFIKTTIEFRSGTPSMTFWCSHLTLDLDDVLLEHELDGKRQTIARIRRDGISTLQLSFDARAADEA